MAPSNLPIMIDKPMHVSLDGLYQLYNLESYKGQFFTCSSSRFSNNFQRFINQLGKNDDIHCETLNTWELYSVHLIDPLVHFGIISSRDEFQAKKIKSGFSQMIIKNDEKKYLHYSNEPKSWNYTFSI